MVVSVDRWRQSGVSYTQTHAVDRDYIHCPKKYALNIFTTLIIVMEKPASKSGSYLVAVKILGPRGDRSSKQHISLTDACTSYSFPHGVWHIVTLSHPVCVMFWKQREGKSHWELHRKSVHFSHDGPSNIHLPAAFLLQFNDSLVIQVYPQQTWIPGLSQFYSYPLNTVSLAISPFKQPRIEYSTAHVSVWYPKSWFILWPGISYPVLLL